MAPSFMTDLTHFLDENGQLPAQMTPEAREMAHKLIEIITALVTNPEKARDGVATGVSCLSDHCNALVTGSLKSINDPVTWFCPECKSRGEIRNWDVLSKSIMEDNEPENNVAALFKEYIEQDMMEEDMTEEDMTEEDMTEEEFMEEDMTDEEFMDDFFDPNVDPIFINMLEDFLSGKFTDMPQEIRPPAPPKINKKGVSRKFDHILQLKITLDGIKPPIWRRIQVPCTYTFWDLHVAIQSAMGWTDSHLHQFVADHPLTAETHYLGVSFEDEGDMIGGSVIPAWTVPLSLYLNLSRRKLIYEYDFGDSWQHIVQLEKIEARDKSKQYPICTGGRRACPPEDCGGPYGYMQMLESLADPSDRMHLEIVQWVGADYNPEYFDRKEVVFIDPEDRFSEYFNDFFG